MRGTPKGFRLAFEQGRYYDAALDEKLHKRWKKRQDPVARSLVMVATAHLHASRHNWAAAKARLHDAQPYVQKLQDRPLGHKLQQHVAACEACCEIHQPLPNLKLA